VCSQELHIYPEPQDNPSPKRADVTNSKTVEATGLVQGYGMVRGQDRRVEQPRLASSLSGD
jgi:hypothetical protein